METLFAFGMPGIPELLIVCFLVLLLFGGAKLPSLMRNMGKSVSEFKKGVNDPSDDYVNADEDDAEEEVTSKKS